MIGQYSKLTFPRLEFVGNAPFTLPEKNPELKHGYKEKPVYRLDWNLFDYGLPKTYLDKLERLTFIPDKDYVQEINHYARQASNDWGRVKGKFDTTLRDIMHEPAIAAANVAFKILFDCVYDPETCFHYRKSDRRVLRAAAMYRFWAMYTGSGLVWEFAELDKLEKLLKTSGSLVGLTESAEIGDFLYVVKSREMKIQEQTIEAAEPLEAKFTGTEQLYDIGIARPVRISDDARNTRGAIRATDLGLISPRKIADPVTGAKEAVLPNKARVTVKEVSAQEIEAEALAEKLTGMPVPASEEQLKWAPSGDPTKDLLELNYRIQELEAKLK